MNKKIIHFAHANGFPSSAYKLFLTELSKDFQVGFLEKHAHNPNFPVTDNWTFLKEELKIEIKRRYDKPIIGVGHSFGGILHVMVSVENPELYEHIVLLDSPLISPIISKLIKISKRTGLIKKLPPAKSTPFRKNFWKTKEEAFEYFRKKDKFCDFDERALRDFVENCLVPNEKGYKLSFDPLIETQIYKTIPHNIPDIYDKITVKFSFIAGTKSMESLLSPIFYTTRHPMLQNFFKIQGSHLFPFEKPIETSQMVRKIILSL